MKMNSDRPCCYGTCSCRVHRTRALPHQWRRMRSECTRFIPKRVRLRDIAKRIERYVPDAERLACVSISAFRAVIGSGRVRFQCFARFRTLRSIRQNGSDQSTAAGHESACAPRGELCRYVGPPSAPIPQNVMSSARAVAPENSIAANAKQRLAPIQAAISSVNSGQGPARHACGGCIVDGFSRPSQACQGLSGHTTSCKAQVVRPA